MLKVISLLQKKNLRGEQMSKVSVIVPVYNASGVIGRCVESILRQDYSDIEVLLIDDGSRDDSYRIISDYAEKDSRVKAIHKDNGGVSSARNLGLDRASGEYVQFVDADDWIPFDATKLMVREMEDSGAQMVIGDFYRVVNDKVSQKGSIKEGGVITRSEYGDNMLFSPADFYYGVLWNKLYRRDILAEYSIRMDDNISYSEDMIFNLEYLLHVEKISVLKAPVYYYVLNEGSLVSQNFNLESIVRMKTSVVKYYTRFYQDTLAEKEYETRKPIIYAYLLAFSTDAFSIPFLNRISRLGEESTGKVRYDSEPEDSGLALGILERELQDKLLASAAKQNQLSLNEMKVLYLLYLKGSSCSFGEIVSLTGLENSSCILSLAGLIRGGFVSADVGLFSQQKTAYRYEEGKLDDDLSRIKSDYDAICLGGFTEEEAEQYRASRERILQNIRKIIG